MDSLESENIRKMKAITLNNIKNTNLTSKIV